MVAECQLEELVEDRLPSEGLQELPAIRYSEFLRFVELRTAWLEKYANYRSISRTYASKAARDVLLAHKAYLLSTRTVGRSEKVRFDAQSSYSAFGQHFGLGRYSLSPSVMRGSGLELEDILDDSVPELWRMYWTLIARDLKSGHRDAFRQLCGTVDRVLGEMKYRDSLALYEQLPTFLAENLGANGLVTRPIHIHDIGVDIQLVRNVFPKLFPGTEEDESQPKSNIIPLDFGHRLVDRPPTDDELAYHILHSTLKGKTLRKKPSIESVREVFGKQIDDNTIPVLWVLPNANNGQVDDPLDDQVWVQMLNTAAEHFENLAVPIYESVESEREVLERIQTGTASADGDVTYDFDINRSKARVAAIEISLFGDGRVDELDTEQYEAFRSEREPKRQKAQSQGKREARLRDGELSLVI